MGRLWQKLIASEKSFLAFLALILVLPGFFHGPRFGLPRVKGGDEPHYLIMLNGFLNDGNFELKENYERVWRGSPEAGRKFAGVLLDPHVVYREGGRFLWWSQVYEDPSKWKKDGQGLPVPQYQNGVDGAALKAYPEHPVGLALLLAAPLWLFRGTPWVEPLALLLSALSMFLCALAFRSLLRRYTPDPALANGCTLLVFLGTPLWAYGRTLFTEPFLACLALGAYALALKRDSGLVPGILLGIGMMMKPVLAVLLFPLFVFWAARRAWGKIASLAVGPALATVVFLALDDSMFGSPFHTPQPFAVGNPLHGALGLWFSWNHGLIPFSPALLPVLFSWKKFIADKREEALLLGSAFLGYFLIMALWKEWTGDWCFGPRLVVPVIPFLAIPAWHTLGVFRAANAWKRALFLFLYALSLAFSALGAVDGYWDSHPLTLLWGNIS